jgi:asparagine synthase (glutamine-hydrolysing)
MSGFVGSFSPENQKQIEEMIQKISHRGSSEPRFWQGNTISFGATDYGQIGENAGPAFSPAGHAAAVIDGRLVNQAQLLDELDFHELNQQEDVELILHYFEELGSRAFGRLQGEFALAITDGERLWLARDRLGIRPLYYGFCERGFYFASEAKALTDVVDEIHEFPAGHFLSSDRGIYPFQPYFPDRRSMDGALESAEHLGELLRQAVQRAIPTGVDVGVWLSGGVDSSVIAALARPLVGELFTFSVGVEGAEDLKYARQVAEHIDARYIERIYQVEEMRQVLEKVIYHLESFDAPLVNSAVANYLVSQLASEYVSFVLTGEGGDELFAGYAYQKEYTSELALTLSVQQAIGSLHNTALQRVDRSASAHGCGVASPFLDPDVVRHALAIPSRWKIRGPQSTDKWPLRRGLADELPDEIIWRGKSKFWEGSGSGKSMAGQAAEEISDSDFEKGRRLPGGDMLRSKEEFLYYQIFKSHFGDKILIEEMGRTKHI